MKYIKQLLFAMAFLVNIFYCKAQWPPTDPAYTITFGDDFNDTTGYNGNNIDINKWWTRPSWNISTTKAYYPNPYDITKTDTLQVAGYNFDPKDTSNVHVIPGSPGICRLIARRGPFVTYIWDDPTYTRKDTFAYSNGSLCSKRFLRYGYYEIRFRLPGLASPDTSHNFLPTCWLFSNEYPRAPDSAGHNEIDIFEIDMSEPSSYDYTNSLYYSYKYKLHDTLDIKIHNDHLYNVSADIWHTGSVFWDKDSITFFYDGIKTGTHKNEQSLNQNYQWHGDSLWPMRVFIEAYVPNGFTHQYLHLPRPQRIDTSQMQLPFVYEIDYFNVWQLKTDCGTDKVYLSTITAAFDSKLYKSLTIGGTGGNADFTGSGKASAYGVDYVLLDEGTTIGTSIEFCANILKCTENVAQFSDIIEPSPGSSTYRRTP